MPEQHALTADEHATLMAALETGKVIIGPFAAPLAASLERKGLGYWCRPSHFHISRFAINNKGRAALLQEESA